jgi:hypothetical protein
MFSLGRSGGPPEGKFQEGFMAGRCRALGVLGFYVITFVGFVGIYLLIIRPWHRTWGATAEETRMPMTADELVASPNYVTTRAVTITAPPEAVWPWLVQMGYKRGGLYSYDWIDRLQKILDRPSANAILPEFQDLKPGDEIPIGGSPGWPVTSLEPNRSLIFDIRQPGVHISWSWQLMPKNEKATRLVLRIRGRVEVKPQTIPVVALLDPGEFTMVRKMLTGIKQRVEGTIRTPADELRELLTWCAAILLGLIGFLGAMFRKFWAPHFALSWAAFLLLFYLMLGQPPLVIGLILNIVLSAALVWAFLRKGRAQRSDFRREIRR